MRPSVAGNVTARRLDRAQQRSQHRLAEALPVLSRSAAKDNFRRALEAALEAAIEAGVPQEELDSVWQEAREVAAAGACCAVLVSSTPGLSASGLSARGVLEALPRSVVPILGKTERARSPARLGWEGRTGGRLSASSRP